LEGNSLCSRQDAKYAKVAETMHRLFEEMPLIAAYGRQDVQL
jgi:hypothetical protein